MASKEGAPPPSDGNLEDDPDALNDFFAGYEPSGQSIIEEPDAGGDELTLAKEPSVSSQYNLTRIREGSENTTVYMHPDITKDDLREGAKIPISQKPGDFTHAKTLQIVSIQWLDTGAGLIETKKSKILLNPKKEVASKKVDVKAQATKQEASSALRSPNESTEYPLDDRKLIFGQRETPVYLAPGFTVLDLLRVVRDGEIITIFRNKGGKGGTADLTPHEALFEPGGQGVIVTHGGRLVFPDYPAGAKRLGATNEKITKHDPKPEKKGNPNVPEDPNAPLPVIE